MNEKELTVYNGLSILAPETAAFFKTGVYIFNTDIEARAYMLAHLSREIEGGIRDILYVKDKGTKCPSCGYRLSESKCLKCDSKIVNGICSICKNIKKLEKCPSCHEPLEGEHLKSILKALGITETTNFAKKWYSTAKKFHKYAHRQGAEKKPRDKDAFDKLWTDFVEILIVLVGDYLSISDRVDSIISNKMPSKQTIDSLSNLFMKESIPVYFFKNLKQLEWLKPLYEKDYFIGNKNPVPIEVEMRDGIKGLSFPRWEVLDYLLFCANEISANKGDFKPLLKIIDSISSYRESDETRVLNPHTDDTIIRLISKLPHNNIEEKHFTYISDALRNPYSYSTLSFESLIIRFINEKDKSSLLKCLDILFSYTKVDNQYKTYYPIFDISLLMQILESDGKNIISICENDGLDIVLKYLEEIAQDESFYDVHTIESHPQNWDLYQYSLQLVFFIRDYFLLGNIEYLRERLKIFIYHEKEIFRRIVFHTINVQYRILKDLLWSLDQNPLDNIINKHELFELIKIHQNELNKEEQTKLLDWIESISYKSLVKEENYEQIIFHEKKEWLLALNDVEDKDIQAAKVKYSELYSHQIEHPGFSSWMSSQVGFESPIQIEEIEKKDFKGVIDLFSKYDTKNALPLYDFNTQGLSKVIEEDITNNIEKYTNDTEGILSASIHFQYVWVAGIIQFLEKDPISFDLYKLLTTINNIISQQSLWDNNNDIPFNHSNWFLSRVLTLLLLLRKHDIESNEKILVEIKKTLYTILKQDKTEIDDYSDLSHLSLNHVQGKLYDALISYLLINDQLENEIKEIITSLLKMEHNNPLLYFSLGKKFTQIYIKDAEWATVNFNFIFQKKHLQTWRASMEGYHLYSGRVDYEILILLRRELNYNLFVENIELFNHTSSFFIITHLLIAFNESIDGFDEKDELYTLLISSNKINIYQDVLNSIFRGIQNVNPDKVKIIWRDLWNLCKNVDSEAKKYFIQESYKLLEYVEEIDEEIEQWILSSSQYVDQFQARYFFNMLTPFISTSMKFVGIIVLKFVTEKSVAMGSNLDRIVDQLYQNKFQEIANKICNVLAEKGNDELRPIYNKYNK